MRNSVVEVVLFVFILTVAVGVSSNSIPNLMIQDSSSSPEVACDLVTVFICEVVNPPKTILKWFVEGDSEASCTSTKCIATNANFTATLNSIGTLFYLTIDTVLLEDNKTIICQSDDVNSNGIMPVRRDKPTESKFVMNKTQSGGNWTVEVISDCMGSAFVLQYQLQIRKSQDNYSAYTDYSVQNATQRKTCPDGESLNCGDPDKFKEFLSMTIPTDTDGEWYTFVFSVFDGTTKIIDGMDIGPYQITNNDTDTTTPYVSTNTQPSSLPPQLSTTSMLHSTKDTSIENNTDMTAQDKSHYIMQQPFIFLIVGGSILILLCFSCIIDIVYIYVNKMKKKEKQDDPTFTIIDIQDESQSTNM